jgi:hypothetical protein
LHAYSLDLSGALPLSVSGLSPRAKEIYHKVRNFIRDEVMPLEGEFVRHAQDPKTKWTIHPQVEELKVS